MKDLPRTPHIVFAGGGTGGHLFPGLAVAEQLRPLLEGARMTFAGSGKPLEQRAVAKAGHEYLPLPCCPLPSRSLTRIGPSAVRFVYNNVRGYQAAVRFLKRQPADVVVGLGGYVSFPMARAATRLGIPLILIEQNAVPGRVTQWLAPQAAMICVSLDEARSQLRAACPVRVTGNPIRAGFDTSNDMPEADEPLSAAASAASLPALLVLGGSQGARTLNVAVPKALYRLRSGLRRWRVIHQSGEDDLQTTRQLYRKLGIPAQVAPFIADLPRVLRQTRLAICRAGGTTLAELAAAGVPALLAPYPQARDDHQRKNAEVYRRAGAAQVIDLSTSGPRPAERIAEELEALLSDAPRRAVMSAAMHALARPAAAWHVAMIVRDFALQGSARIVA